MHVHVEWHYHQLQVVFFFSNSAYVIIIHNDELKYSYFDWKNEDLLDEMKKKKIAYRDEPVNKE